jgi:hypothetical protein
VVEAPRGVRLRTDVRLYRADLMLSGEQAPGPSALAGVVRAAGFAAKSAASGQEPGGLLVPGASQAGASQPLLMTTAPGRRDRYLAGRRSG